MPEVTLEQLNQAEERVSQARGVAQVAQADLALALADFKSLKAAYEFQRKEAGRAQYAHNMAIAAQRAAARATPVATRSAPDMQELADTLEREAAAKADGRQWAGWTVAYPSGANRMVNDALEAAGKVISASKKPGITRVFVTYRKGMRQEDFRTLIYTVNGAS